MMEIPKGTTLIEDITSFHKFIFSKDLLKKRSVGISVENTTFRGLDLSHYDMGNVSFQNCVFIGCNLSFANLANCEFTDVKIFTSLFKYAKLTASEFESVDIQKSNFCSAILTGIVLVDVNIESTIFSTSDLVSSIWRNVRINRAVFLCSDISNAILRDVWIEASDLTGTQLSDSRLVNTTISHSNLSLSNIRYSYFLNVSLKKVPIINMKCYNAVFYSLRVEQTDVSVCDEAEFIRFQNQTLFDAYSFALAFVTPFVMGDACPAKKKNHRQQYHPDAWGNYITKPLYIYCGIDEYYISNGHLRFKYGAEVHSKYTHIKEMPAFREYNVWRLLSCCFEDFGLGNELHIKDIICYEMNLIYFIEEKDLSVPWLLDSILEAFKSELLQNRRIVSIISEIPIDCFLQILNTAIDGDRRLQQYISHRAKWFIKIDNCSADNLRKAASKLRI